jgi:hypothetical protein
MLHAVTPFSRWENLDFYMKHFESLDIIWDVITDDPSRIPPQHNVRPYYCSNESKGDDICYRKLNMFLVDAPIVESDRYFFLCDDDWIDTSIIDKLAAMDDDVIFVSMKRGHNFLGGHPTTTLIASPSVHVGTIGLEQMFLKGKIMRQVRFRSDHYPASDYPSHRQGSPDGHMAEMLMKLYPVRYEPDLYVYFNMLESGRWNKGEAL